MGVALINKETGEVAIFFKLLNFRRFLLHEYNGYFPVKINGQMGTFNHGAPENDKFYWMFLVEADE